MSWNGRLKWAKPPTMNENAPSQDEINAMLMLKIAEMEVAITNEKYLIKFITKGHLQR